MTTLDDALLRWAVDSVAPGADVVEVRGLRDGGSPWLVRFGHDDAVVVRVGSAGDRAMFETEVAALRIVAAHVLPGPRLLGARLSADQPAIILDRVPGSSAIPPEAPLARLRRLGAVAAAVHALRPDPEPALPRRERPIAPVDFAALRREQPPRPLLTAAEAAVAAHPVPGGSGFVHGDLWQGNAMWLGDDLTAVIDWDCAGIGPAGVDLGSLRCDAALTHGAAGAHSTAAAEEVRRGWEAAAGRPAEDVAYWDVVAALSTPPDMGWFAGAIAGQGRPDLTREILLARRDSFLADALSRLSGVSEHPPDN